MFAILHVTDVSPGRCCIVTGISSRSMQPCVFSGVCLQNGGSEQVISGFGHSILPGVIPHEQLSQCIFMYRVSGHKDAHCQEVTSSI